MKSYRLFVVGKTPPPTGGVTIFNQKLCKILTEHDIEVTLIKNKVKIVKEIFDIKRKHYLLSYSNRPLLLFHSLFLKLIGSHVSVIVHGDVERGSKIYAKIVSIIARMAFKIVVLNESSYHYLNGHRNVLHLGTNLSEIKEFKIGQNRNIKYQFVTYASRNEITRDGKELYGINFLYEFFLQRNNNLTIIDPSNGYKHLQETANIRFIRETVNMEHYLGHPWVYIRNTVSDGDSLLIHEAMAKGSPVVASDAVNRPEGVLLFRYSDNIDMELKISQLVGYVTPRPNSSVDDWVEFTRQFCLI